MGSVQIFWVCFSEFKTSWCNSLEDFGEVWIANTALWAAVSAAPQHSQAQCLLFSHLTSLNCYQTEKVLNKYDETQNSVCKRGSKTALFWKILRCALNKYLLLSCFTSHIQMFHTTNSIGLDCSYAGRTLYFSCDFKPTDKYSLVEIKSLKS